jgi:hypothetical protein
MPPWAEPLSNAFFWKGAESTEAAELLHRIMEMPEKVAVEGTAPKALLNRRKYSGALQI